MMAAIEVVFEFKAYTRVLRTTKAKLCREIEQHLRRVFAADDPYVLSTCPSTCPTGSALPHSRERINIFYLQRYNAKHDRFVNIDSVEEINEGDKISVTKLDSEDGVDMYSASARDEAGHQRPDVVNSEVSRLAMVYSYTSVADPGWGIWGKFPPPPPPSRNCIQDRDTLIEQSITLIKQSQCS